MGGARRHRPAHLRLVADHGRLVNPVFESGAGRRGEARSDRAGAQGRLRLTRRGRLMITSTVVLLVAVVSMVLASTAEAVVHL
jgi:hypothetical protein